jgi:hypothetical protein
VFALALAGTCAVGLIASPAAEATTPPWQVGGNADNDPNAVGTLSFFDATGTQIYGGTTSDAPLAAYVEGSSAVNAGDTKATLYAYLPESGTAAAGWSGVQLTAASVYPNGSAPAAISATLPVVSSTAADTSLADFIAGYPNGSTATGYQGSYELRLRTSRPGVPIQPGYDVADIQVTGSTWQVVYPAQTTATTTALTASPASGAKAGSSITLTATVTSAVEGTVQFRDGTTALGAPVTVAAGSAGKAITVATAGTHSYTATFAPTPTTPFSGSIGALSYAVAKATPTVTATWPSSRPIYGRSFTVQAAVTAHGLTPSGVVSVKYGTKTLTSKALVSGKATLTVSGTALTPGSRNLTLSYAGSANVTAGSTPKTLMVLKAPSKTTDALSSTRVPHTSAAKLAVRVTATGTIPTGTIRVYDGSRLIKTVTLTASARGKIVITLPKLRVGRHKIHAAYSGSSLVAASTGAILILTST